MADTPIRLSYQSDRALRSRGDLQNVEVGGWQLVRRLDAGAWFEVYQAMPTRCTTRRADYVVKLIRPEHADNPLALAMLRQETRLSSEVAHTNLATILAARLEGAPQYVVMPLLAGATVRAMLSRGVPLKPPHALWIARQVIQALRVLHDRGWFHCDVKPENIYVAPSGHTTLLDLGLAQTVDSAAQLEFAGTPNYAAPEWFSRSLRATPRCDIYSVGVLLFEMLTGKLPREVIDWNTAGSVQGRASSPRELVPQLPSRVGQLIAQLLANEPLRRPTASELIERLVDLEIDLLDERFAA